MPSPFVRWAGGKRLLVKHLLPLFPEHTCYAEVFGGGGAVLFTKPRSKVEVFNDVNGELVNLYRQVQAHPEEMARQVARLPHSREIFAELLATTGGTEIQRAVRFLYVNRRSFGGMGSHYGYAKTCADAGSISISQALAAASTRLERVFVERLDWRKLIAAYDGPETFFFCDPPYLGCSDTSYAAWSFEELAELRQTLSGIRGNWLLTINDSEEVRELFSGCSLTAIDRPNGIGNRFARKNGGRYAELIVKLS